MALPADTILGPYVLESLVGSGGMGEVYRARDTRLDRIVALKTLRSELAAQSDLKARFEREARAISALSSPHIAALYDVGSAEGVEYLVMEYLDGETLADRIARGPLPLTQVVRYGAEIAEALQHAHRAGIVHRDLKPGNVMLTPSGVKLLDFGLAILASPSRASADATTVVTPITAAGTIVGTLFYMAPEQIEGRPLDARTDIFALGAILYEMVTGQRPFSGTSQLGLITAILSADPPPLRNLQPGVPATLERIVQTALEKNPDDRWQTAQDVARQLRWLNESSPSAGMPALPASPRTAGARNPLLLAAVLGVLAAGAAWSGMNLWRGQTATPQTRFHLDLSPPEGVTARSSPETSNFALSPDGQTLCFGGADKDGRALFLRRLDSFELRKLEGSNDGVAPFWSSDGAWIGFSARGKIWKTKADGNGVAVPLCDTVPTGAVASWVGETVLFADRAGGRNRIFRIPASGGTAVPVTAIGPGEWFHSWPHLLADGRHFLYYVAERSIGRQLRLASLDDPRASTVLLRDVSGATQLRPDELAFVRDGKLLAQHFDVRAGKMTGESTLVAENVSYFYPSGKADFDAANGVIVYRTDTSRGRLVAADRSGATRVIDDHNLFSPLSLGVSRDGQRVAVTILDRATGLGDIWIYDLPRGVVDRFTHEPGLALSPVWAPDGRSIVYAAAGAGALPHLVRRSLASPAAEGLLSEGEFQFPGSISADGALLYYTRSREATENVYRLDLRTRHSEPLLDTSFREQEPVLSPDAKWLAFSSDATGSHEIYLQNVGVADSPRVRVSTNGGQSPSWRGDGGELFYLSPGKSVVGVVPRGSWERPQATELFRASADATTCAALPDGQSFLFIESSPGPNDALFHVIVAR